MATKKKVAQPVIQMRPDLPYFDQEEDAKKTATAPDAAMTSLLARLDQMEQALKVQTNANLALMQQPMVTVPPKVQTEIDMKSLPDPVTEPEAHAKALNEQIGAVFDGRSKMAEYNNTQNQTHQQRVAGLWSKFASDHADYATDPEKIEIVATRVVQQKAAMGLDTSKYMFLTPELFAKDVIAGYDKLFGKPKTEDGEEQEPVSGVPAVTALASDDEDEGNTAGIFGGIEGGGKPAAGPKAPPADDMLADVRAWQIKTGFSR